MLLVISSFVPLARSDSIIKYRQYKEDITKN